MTSLISKRLIVRLFNMTLTPLSYFFIFFGTSRSPFSHPSHIPPTSYPFSISCFSFITTTGSATLPQKGMGSIAQQVRPYSRLTLLPFPSLHSSLSHPYSPCPHILTTPHFTLFPPAGNFFPITLTSYSRYLSCLLLRTYILFPTHVLLSCLL